jgi:TRAP-type C4-dicarboxylate transport system permease small subunit
MLQAALSNLLMASLILIFLGVFAFGWLVVHVEHSRHRSAVKIALALILGAIMIGFGLHFFLIASGI